MDGKIFKQIEEKRAKALLSDGRIILDEVLQLIKREMPWINTERLYYVDYQWLYSHCHRSPGEGNKKFKKAVYELMEAFGVSPVPVVYVTYGDKAYCIPEISDLPNASGYYPVLEVPYRRGIERRLERLRDVLRISVSIADMYAHLGLRTAAGVEEHDLGHKRLEAGFRREAIAEEGEDAEHVDQPPAAEGGGAGEGRVEEEAAEEDRRRGQRARGAAQGPGEPVELQEVRRAVEELGEYLVEEVRNRKLSHKEAIMAVYAAARLGRRLGALAKLYEKAEEAGVASALLVMDVDPNAFKEVLRAFHPEVYRRALRCL